MKIWLKIALNAVRLPKFEPVIVVAAKDHGKRFTATFRVGVILRMRRELRGLGPYTVLPDNSILITANMQSETGFPRRL